MEYVIQLNDFELVNDQQMLDLSFVLNEGYNSVEIYISKDSTNHLYLTQNPNGASIYNQSLSNPISFEDFCAYISLERIPLTIFCNLVEADLELQVTNLSKVYDVFSQIRFSGVINPVFISKWDHPKIFYDIQNCLPNIYNQDYLKEHHIDVFNYFCNLYKLDNILVKDDFYHNEIEEWLEIDNISIGIYQSQNSDLSDIDTVDYLFIELSVANSLSNASVQSR